jgi:hypothetical protein
MLETNLMYQTGAESMVSLIDNDTPEAAKLMRTAVHLLANLKRTAAELEADMLEEVTRSRVKDPRDAAFSLIARAMADRLNNLRASISLLERAAL